MYEPYAMILVNNFWGDQIEVLQLSTGDHAAATYCNTPEGREDNTVDHELRPYYRMLHAGYEVYRKGWSTVLINSIHSEWLDATLNAPRWKLKLLGELTLNRTDWPAEASFFTQMNVNPERTRAILSTDRLLLVRIKQMNMNILDDTRYPSHFGPAVISPTLSRRVLFTVALDQ
ncbi:hypothetical protein SPFM20_00088 [Salmonella phage SPFM20]|nr:hypothetical protein SPFM20_00088 [Salmonella phage SPFM20]